MVLLLAFFTPAAFGQTPISGKVVDEQCQGIPGVTVSVKGKIRSFQKQTSVLEVVDTAGVQDEEFELFGPDSRDKGSCTANCLPGSCWRKTFVLYSYFTGAGTTRARFRKEWPTYASRLTKLRPD